MIIWILGLSGSGKTTLAKMIMGVVPTQNAIDARHRRAEKSTTARRSRAAPLSAEGRQVHSTFQSSPLFAIRYLLQTIVHHCSPPFTTIVH